MALSLPSYLQSTQLAGKNLRYEWDEWHVKKYYSDVDEGFFDRLTKLTHRAKTAMTIASAEWLVRRFDCVSDDRVPWQYLEAAWAANVDTRYGRYIETDDDEWRGPVRGPLNMAITIVADSLFCAEESAEPAENPAWMCALAEHVLPEHVPFRNWRDSCLQLLERSFLASVADEEEDLFEDAEDLKDVSLVPREVFNPELTIRDEVIPELVDRFLRGLDYRTNPFLRSPKEIIERGFEGTPYRY